MYAVFIMKLQNPQIIKLSAKINFLACVYVGIKSYVAMETTMVYFALKQADYYIMVLIDTCITLNFGTALLQWIIVGLLKRFLSVH